MYFSISLTHATLGNYLNGYFTIDNSYNIINFYDISDLNTNILTVPPHAAEYSLAQLNSLSINVYNPITANQLGSVQGTFISKIISLQNQVPKTQYPTGYYRLSYADNNNTWLDFYTPTETKININLNTQVVITPILAPLSNVCFPKGTPVNTDQGIIDIDRINITKHTINNKKIVCVTETRSTEDFLVCIEKGAILNGAFKNDKIIPTNTTYITANHIIYHGRPRPAIGFVNNTTITKVPYNNELLYNIVMEQHDTMIINGLLCETLDPENSIAKLYQLYNSVPLDKKEHIMKFWNANVLNAIKTN